MNLPVEQQIAKQCLAGKIRVLHRVISRIYDAKLRPFGVRASQINILIAVAARGPLTPTKLSGLLCMEKSTLSRDLTRLVEQEWIRSTTGAGRGRQLEITTAGLALIKKLAPAWNEAQTEAQRILGTSLAKELGRVVDELRSGDRSTE